MKRLSLAGILALSYLAVWASACGSAGVNHATSSSSSSGAPSGGGGAGAQGGTGGAGAHGGAGSGGASGTGGMSGTGGTSGTGGACGTAAKLCGGSCVPLDPQHGCASASCTPCSIANGTAGCEASGCTVVSCDAGWTDCDKDPSNGCETHTDADVDNCGACKRACSSTGVAAKVCSGGVCTSTCVPGKGNCAQPAAPAADDGCETSTASNNQDCGGCGNACANAMFNTNPACDQGLAAQKVCGCSTLFECEYGDHTAPTCTGLGRCVCNGTTCQAGEACKDPSATDGTFGDVCTCYGGAACTTGQSCCQTPAGCHDLQTDAQSCGACGHACAPGFGCAAGQCACSGDASCNGGAAAGTFHCVGGLCTCGTTACGAGQRCLPGGTCG